jgi:hypothetical protein
MHEMLAGAEWVRVERGLRFFPCFEAERKMCINKSKQVNIEN